MSALREAYESNLRIASGYLHSTLRVLRLETSHGDCMIIVEQVPKPAGQGQVSYNVLCEYPDDRQEFIIAMRKAKAKIR